LIQGSVFPISLVKVKTVRGKYIWVNVVTKKGEYIQMQLYWDNN